MRNFTEERRRQLINDEFSKTVDRVFAGSDPVLGEYIKNHYRQNSLLDLLFRSAEKAAREGSKTSLYTKRIKKDANRKNLPVR